MPVDAVAPVLNVSSIAESFAWFRLFGWESSFAWNEGGLVGEGPDCRTENEHGPAGFGGVCQGRATIFLCVDCQGSKGTRLPSSPGCDDTDGVWMSWWVNSRTEVDRLHGVAVENNCTVTWPPTDEPWGVREFHLRHPDGHMFRVGCGLPEEGREEETLYVLARNWARLLRGVPDRDAARKPRPEAWCAKEILGHLIDSAVNNYGRFARAILEDPMVYPGYDQEAWVRMQGYQDINWLDLIELWEHLNVRIAALVESAEHEVLTRARAEHNLHEIAWKPPGAGEPVTLEYFYQDYVAHLKHHLAQIEPDSASPS